MRPVSMRRLCRHAIWRTPRVHRLRGSREPVTTELGTAAVATHTGKPRKRRGRGVPTAGLAVLVLAAAAASPGQAATQDDSGGLSPLVVGLVSFGFAAAGTAFAIVLVGSIRSAGRRRGSPQVPAPPRAVREPVTLPPRAEPPPARVDPLPPPTRVDPSPPTLVDPSPPQARVEPSPLAAPRVTPRLLGASSQSETCTLELWRGYVKWRFYATTTEPDGTETTVAASPFFRVGRGHSIEDSAAAHEAYDAIVAELVALGWEPADDQAFTQRFRRRDRVPAGHLPEYG